MRCSRPFCSLALALFCTLLGCGPSESPPETPEVPDEDVRALTREQIEEHAEAMSPEVAESLGIVDTTIRIESPMPAESVQPPNFIPDSVPPI